MPSKVPDIAFIGWIAFSNGGSCNLSANEVTFFATQSETFASPRVTDLFFPPGRRKKVKWWELADPPLQVEDANPYCWETQIVLF